jgi:hypothetical protein
VDAGETLRRTLTRRSDVDVPAFALRADDPSLQLAGVAGARRAGQASPAAR